MLSKATNCEICHLIKITQSITKARIIFACKLRESKNHQIAYCIEYFKGLWGVHRKYNFQSPKIMYINGTSDCNLKVVCFHDMAKEHATKYTIRILSPEKSFRWQ